VGTWEIGHEHRTHPDLATAFEQWMSAYADGVGWQRHYQNEGAGNVTLASWTATHGITDPHQDSDGNGLADLIDFLIGNNPSTGEGQSSVMHSALTTLNVDGSDDEYFTIAIDVDPLAEGVEYRVEGSDNLIDWSAGDSIMLIYETIANPDGSIQVVWRSAAPIGQGTMRKFARVSVRQVNVNP